MKNPAHPIHPAESAASTSNAAKHRRAGLDRQIHISSTRDDQEEPAGSQILSAEEIAAAHESALNDSGRAWAAALADILGIGTRGIGSPNFSWGPPGGDDMTEYVRGVAGRRGCDIVHLVFDDPVEDGPTNILLATFGRKGVELFENCELWAIPRYERVEILTTTHRFHLNENCRLQRKVNRLDHMRARRVRMAHDLWRVRAAEKLKSGFPARLAPPLQSAAISADGTYAEGFRAVGEAWAVALRDLMRAEGQPAAKKPFLIRYGDESGFTIRGGLLTLSWNEARDVVYLGFGGPTLDDGPTDVTVVLFSRTEELVFHCCQVSADSATAPFHLLHEDQRMVVGDRNQLVLQPTLPGDDTGRSQAKSHKRWKVAAREAAQRERATAVTASTPTDPARETADH